MPIICQFRGIKIYMYWEDHLPPHFHAEYAGQEAVVDIRELEILHGKLPNKIEKMVLGWAALHQEELFEEWNLASKNQELFPIEGLK
ncbi:hypothetical protein SY88_11710 [Clostridiales bacterium PH28_bin88]|nr:hypothetical protein SY88_11710 [Clostridiales bacterium PH28_bin88]